MKKILKNKKGVIGFLSGATDSIVGIIQTLTNIIPKPVLFIIFIFLLVAVGSALSLLFNVFGIYCNSADLPVQLGAGITSGISLIGQVPDPTLLSSESINLEEGGYTILSDQVTECSTRVPSGTIIFKDKTTINFTTPTDFYDGQFCTECEEVEVYTELTGRVGGFTKKWCYGDVTRDEEKNLVQRALCGGTACEPPQHYYYDQSQNLYQCADLTCMGITQGQKWDELLKSKGATLMYNTIDETNPSSERFVGITCNELSPRLAVYGIDIFNFSMWMMIMVIILLLWMIKTIYG